MTTSLLTHITGLDTEATFKSLTFPLSKDQFKADGFPDFVGIVASLGNAQYQLDEHFTPLSVHCKEGDVLLTREHC